MSADSSSGGTSGGAARHKAASNSAELVQFPPGLGLASMGFESLAVHALLRFQRVPIVENHTVNVTLSPFDDLPVLHVAGNTCFGMEEAVHALRQAHELDRALSEDVLADCECLRAYLHERLALLVSYLWYGISDNCDKILCAALEKHMTFMQRFWITRRVIAAHRRRMEQTRLVTHFASDDDLDEAQMTALLDETLSTAAAKLRGRSLFFGRIPSSADAVLFAGLSCLTVPVLERNPFAQRIRDKFSSLVSFREEIEQKYYGADREMLLKTQIKKPRVADTGARDASKAPEAQKQEDEYAGQKKRAALIAAGMIGAYIVLSGLGAQIYRAIMDTPADNDNDDDDEDYDDDDDDDDVGVGNNDDDDDDDEDDE